MLSRVNLFLMFAIMISIFSSIILVSRCLSDEIVKGEYCYTYGDKESLEEAKQYTKTLAIRDAIEKYKIYVSASARVKDFSLTDDEIRTLTSGYLKKMKTKSSVSDRTVCYSINAFVDPKEFERALQQAIAKKNAIIEKNEHEKDPDKKGPSLNDDSIGLKIVDENIERIVAPMNDGYQYIYVVKVKASTKYLYWSMYPVIGNYISIKCFDRENTLLGIYKGDVSQDLDEGETYKVYVNGPYKSHHEKDECYELKAKIEKY